MQTQNSYCDQASLGQSGLVDTVPGVVFKYVANLGKGTKNNFSEECKEGSTASATHILDLVFTQSEKAEIL